MSWWELFRQAIDDEGYPLIPDSEGPSVSKGKVNVLPRQTKISWANHRDYIAARRYWNKSSTQSEVL